VKLGKDFSLVLIQTAAAIVDTDKGKMSDHYFWKFLNDVEVLCKENFASNKEKTVDL